MNTLGSIATMSTNQTTTGGSNPAPLALSPAPAMRLSREPSKEDLELAEQLVNHSKGIQQRPREAAAQPGSDTSEAPSHSGPEHQTHGGEAGETKTQAEHGSANNLPVQQPVHEMQNPHQRPSLGVPAGGQVCRYVAIPVALPETC